jgi:NADH dehydrogenase
VHVVGAARVTRLAAAAGVRRLLHLSALGIAEDAPAAADRTKARGEMAVRAAFPAATLVRPSLIDGPGDPFFRHFAAMTTTSPVLPVIGGRTRFPPIHIVTAA